MTIAMRMPPRTLPTTLPLFADQFLSATIAAGMINPLASSGTNYASEQEGKWKRFEMPGASVEDTKLLSTLWTGTDMLPPQHRSLPRLLETPSVSTSPQDQEAIKSLGAMPTADIKQGEWVTFAHQLSYLRDAVEYMQKRLQFLKKAGKKMQFLVKHAEDIIDEGDISSIKKRWLGYESLDFGDLSLAKAIALMSSGRSNDKKKAAHELGEARQQSHGFNLLGGMMYEVARDLFISAGGKHTLDASNMNFHAICDYNKALHTFSILHQDPLGCSIMSERVQIIAMTEALRARALGHDESRWLEKCREALELLHDSSPEDDARVLVGHRARQLYFGVRIRRYDDPSPLVDVAVRLIGDIAALLAECEESQENITAVRAWAESARAFAR